MSITFRMMSEQVRQQHSRVMSPFMLENIAHLQKPGLLKGGYSLPEDPFSLTLFWPKSVYSSPFAQAEMDMEHPL